MGEHATRDLFEHIRGGGQAAWKAYVQIMPFADAETYRYDPFDVTKVWLYKDYPLIPIGRLVLDRNPDNFFAQIEQAAFSPANFVPGVEASPDKLLQGRLFSYPDTQRHRLGPNHALIPVNCPHAGTISNYQRDGIMRIDSNGGAAVNYEPNSYGGPSQQASAREVAIALTGPAARTDYPPRGHDFEQAGLLYSVFKPEERARLINNLAGHMKGIDRAIQVRQMGHFLRAHEEYGTRVAAALGIALNDVNAAIAR